MAKTLQGVISMVDDIKPNAFNNDTKTLWINEVEGLVQTEVFLLAQEEVVSYAYEADKERELLVATPHDKIYWAYLAAMVDFANGEYNKYQNSMQVFNAYFKEYMRWFAGVYRPADGEAVERGYYLSAYRLALLHGYEGTEEEWIASLKGDKGDTGESAYEAAKAKGYSGTEEEWIASLKGEKGDTGRSAYQEAVLLGYEGTEEEWIASLKGEKGDTFKFEDLTAEDLAQLRGEAGEVIDNLTSTATTKPLSANQGRILDGKIGKKLDASGVTENSFLVGAGASEMDEKTPAEVLSLIGALGFKKLLTAADNCNSLEDGIYWYSTSSVPANAPFANAAVMIAFGGGNRQIQMGFRYGQVGLGKFRAKQDSSWRAWAEFAGFIESADYPGCYYRMNGDVQEWVNPPLVEGVEYRTIERHNGKPVYVKRINFGSLPASSEKALYYITSSVDKNGGTVVRWAAFATSGSGNSNIFPFYTSNGTLRAKIYFTQWSVAFYAFSDSSGNTSDVTVWYIHNSD